MYIDPIHAGPVALAHAFALAARAPRHGDDSAGAAPASGAPRRHRFKPLMRLLRWWRRPYGADFPITDPQQLMMGSEGAERPCVTALDGMLMMKQLRRNRTGPR